jgi:putative intracellular protease/amidase
MPNKFAYLYLLDTLADWETGYVTAELNSNRYFREGAPHYSVKTFSAGKKIITSMGGIRIVPDCSIEEITLQDAGLLLLPGADLWHEPKHKPVFDLVEKFLTLGITVAAICGATVALANAGFLDNRKHTSNDLNFLLQTCPNYKGKSNYVNQPVVADNNLITATPLAPLEFAREILAKLEVFTGDTLNAWFQLHQTKNSGYFMKLMQSLPTS